jgi:hypothetical protein
MLLTDVVLPALDPDVVRREEHVRVGVSGRRLEAVGTS